MKKVRHACLRAAIVGATGYGGIGTIEILLRHPNVEVTRLFSQTDVGRPLSAVYPHLAGFCDLPLESLGEPVDVDVVFFSTPDGVGRTHAPAWVERGVKVIDFSMDFRHDASAVYGVPELHREKIASAPVVANPGCFAIACILGLAPGAKIFKNIICDCKSGVSGAGKKAASAHHYPARYDAVNAYKIGSHQHVPEIEREVGAKITFTPHVLPMTRGILATLYADCDSDVTDLYRDFYRNEPFVRIVSGAPSTADVRGSNFCNLWINRDERTGKAIIVSHIDNLMKGQAGNAVQNMNVMMGLDETLGLMSPGQYP